LDEPENSNNPDKMKQAVEEQLAFLKRKLGKDTKQP
jgi:hypothetical protein